MPEFIKSIRPSPAPLPPAAGQFGYRSLGPMVSLNALRPSGCPSPDQFEAAFVFAKQPPKAR